MNIMQMENGIMNITQEDKEILLRYLSMALPYELRVKLKYSDEHGSHIRDNCCKKGVEILNPLILDLFFKQEIHIKPYLRPMSDMTEEEKKEYRKTQITKWVKSVDCTNGGYYEHRDTLKTFDWLNAYHFDYRGLIDKGLAIAVTEENNPYK